MLPARFQGRTAQIWTALSAIHTARYPKAKTIREWRTVIRGNGVYVGNNNE